MFPEQEKIDLFARKNYEGWDNWGLEIPTSEIPIFSKSEMLKDDNLIVKQLTI